MNATSKEDATQRPNGRTDAFYATQKECNGACPELEECLDTGVDPNAVDDKGDTAMHWACWNLRPRALEILLDRGASPNFQNHRGDTPLHHVISRDRNQDTYRMARVLLDAGAIASLPNHRGDTAYHVLMRRSRMLQAHEATGLVRLLSEKAGTDGWFVVNEEGKTPLEIARETNDQNIAPLVAALQGSVLEQTTAKISSKAPASRRL